jgi:hypothetical protein
MVCTTNFDFLLEQQYTHTSRFCRPIIDEEQLSISGRESDITLLKLHGDLHHPQRLVVTEEDYDRFLDTYPLLATYLANLLISRTPLLIGYSLDDPDFRQVWQVVNDRLGRLRRPAFAIAVDASATDIARFARRGVRLISLPGVKSDYSRILAAAFVELRQFWTDHIVSVSQVTDEEPLNELSLPPEAKTRLCFFSVPLSLLAFYRENAFPIAERYGFVPISANDMISPGENWLAKIETLIERSVLVVVDASTRTTLLELEVAVSKLGKPDVFIIQEENAVLPSLSQAVLIHQRPSIPSSEPPEFLKELESWFERLSASLAAEYVEEPMRLYRLGQHRAAVTSAITLLEVYLRDRISTGTTQGRRPMSIINLIDLAKDQNLIDAATALKTRDWLRIRNSVAHSLVVVRPEDAQEIVEGVMKIISDANKPKSPRENRKK